MHEWSASLNEGGHSPVLPSNRETGCLSDTRIKMDALYFPPCSVREQGKTGGGGKERERRNAGGMTERYKERASEWKTKGQNTVGGLASQERVVFLHHKPVLQVIRETMDPL